MLGGYVREKRSEGRGGGKIGGKGRIRGKQLRKQYEGG